VQVQAMAAYIDEPAWMVRATCQLLMMFRSPPGD
jgi:hypothetical protein